MTTDPATRECPPCSRDAHERCTTTALDGSTCECWRYDHYGLLDGPDDDWLDVDEAGADARQRRYERMYGW